MSHNILPPRSGLRFPHPLDRLGTEEYWEGRPLPSHHVNCDHCQGGTQLVWGALRIPTVPPGWGYFWCGSDEQYACRLHCPKCRCEETARPECPF